MEMVNYFTLSIVLNAINSEAAANSVMMGDNVDTHCEAQNARANAAIEATAANVRRLSCIFPSVFEWIENQKGGEFNTTPSDNLLFELLEKQTNV